MIQSGLKQEQKLKITQINVKTSGQAKWIQKIVPLKYNQVFIYYDGGSYEMYDIDKQEIALKGQLPDDIIFFLEIYTKVLIFHDPTDLQIKLLDLNSNQINLKFVFRSSDQIDINCHKNSREIIVDKFRVFFLDCQEKQIKYLISQDLEKHYSKNNVCHYFIRVLPLSYDSETNFELQPVTKYNYPNSIESEELFYWQVDKETIAVYGQENINQKSEILFIKPHLMEKAFYIVHTEYQQSFITINVSNWVIPHQVAIWVNNNEGTKRSSIFTIDLRNYYDGKSWLPEPQFTATLASDQYIGNDPETFMDIYQFNLDSTYVIQFRQVGVDPKISIINYQNIQKPEIMSEFQVDSFFHEIAVDHSYILFYNDLVIDNQIVKFSLLLPINTKYQLLKILEKAKIIEKYGIHVVEELFDYY